MISKGYDQKCNYIDKDVLYMVISVLFLNVIKTLSH